jgi:hypothetical protein
MTTSLRRTRTRYVLCRRRRSTAPAARPGVYRLRQGLFNLLLGERHRLLDLSKTRKGTPHACLNTHLGDESVPKMHSRTCSLHALLKGTLEEGLGQRCADESRLRMNHGTTELTRTPCGPHTHAQIDSGRRAQP